MQQTVTRRYASPAAFEAELQQLSCRGWTVRGFDQTMAAQRRAFHRTRKQIVVTYVRSDNEPEAAAPVPVAPQLEVPWLDLKVPWLASRWGKVLAAAGTALVVLGFVMSGKGPDRSSVAAEGISIQALGQMSASQLPADPQAVAYSRDLKWLLNSYDSSLQTLASLNAKPQMSSGAWQAQLRRTTQSLRSEDASLRLLVPPACLASIHKQLLDAATGIDKATDRIDGAVRVQSTASVSQWSQAALSVGGAMKDLSAKMSTAKC